MNNSHFLYNSKKVQSLIGEFGSIEANKIIKSSKIYKKYYLENDQIASVNDFFKYLKSIKYWKLDKKYIPLHIYEFVYMNRLRIYINNHHTLKKYKELQYLLSIDIIINDINYEKNIINYCAYIGYLNCIKILLDRFYPYDCETYGRAAFYGHIECLQYLYKFNSFLRDRVQFDESVIWAAINGGHTDCIHYVANNSHCIGFCLR
jgi:hypothetical protein